MKEPIMQHDARRMSETFFEDGWREGVRRSYLEIRRRLGWGMGTGNAFYRHVLLRVAHTVLSANAPECDDVVAWAREHKMPVQILQEQRVFERTISPDSTPEQLPYILPRAQGTALRKYLCFLQGPSIVGNTGLLILPDGSYATESVYGSPTLANERKKFGEREYRLQTKRGMYFSLVDLWDLLGGRNYYHWMHDVVSRLYLVLDHLPAETLFIVRGDLAPYAIESLELLGIDRRRLRFIPQDQVWQLETLWFTAPTQHSGNDAPGVPDWFRERYHGAVGASTAPPTRRIFVSRESARSRRIINAKEFVSFLVAHGFESVETEKLSVAEQVRLFAGAEMVVFVHGAAGANLWFMRPHGMILEILEPSIIDKSFVFWTACEAIGLKYYTVIAESVPNPGDYPDVRVPMELFRQRFAEMMVKHERESN